MNNKGNKKQLYLGIAGLAIALLIGINVVGAVVAQSDEVGIDKLIELGKAVGGGDAFIAGINFLGSNASTMLGASGDYLLSSFTADAIRTSGITIDGDAYFSEDIDFSSSTSTPTTKGYFPVVESLDLTATSTLKGATQNVIASWKNTGSQKLLTRLGIGLTTQFNSFAGSIQCGKTTSLGDTSLNATTSDFMIASTTIAATYDINDSGVLDILSTTTHVMVDNNEVIFCTWTPYGATSTDSFEASGGFTGAGKMIADVFAW